MGYTLTPIAVDLSKVTAVIGSRDESLLAALTKKLKEELDEIDAVGEDYEEDGDEGPAARYAGKPKEALASMQADLERLLRGEKLDKDCLTAWLLSDEEPPQKASAQAGTPCASTGEALRHLVMGEAPDRRVGFNYGYVLQSLCRHYGEALPNDRWSSLRRGSQWFRGLDRALRAADIPVEALSVTKHLAERGSPVPIPEYSDFPSIGYMRSVEVETALAALGGTDFRAVDPEARAYVEDVKHWLRRCSELQCDLVCFYA
jgi:hypothetical protein